MRFGSYRLDIPFDQLKRYRRLLIQLPAGLKIHAKEIVDAIEERTGCETVLSSEPTFGACDLDVDSARSIGADALVHLGHLPIPNVKIDFPVIFLNVSLDTDVDAISEMIYKKVGENSVNLVTTAQHIDIIHDLRKKLDEQGLLAYVEEGDDRIFTPGLVLGCNFSSALYEKGESVVFIGTGNFHPLGISLATSKPVYALDPVSMKIRDPGEINKEKEELLKKRYSLVSLAEDADDFAVLVSKKPGQKRMDLALRIRDKLREKGKRAYIIIFGNIEPDLLRDFGGFDCLVSTACPRLAIDDYMNFDVPIITPIEFEILVGERGLDDYIFDTIS